MGACPADRWSRPVGIVGLGRLGRALAGAGDARPCCSTPAARRRSGVPLGVCLALGDRRHEQPRKQDDPGRHRPPPLPRLPRAETRPAEVAPPEWITCAERVVTGGDA